MHVELPILAIVVIVAVVAGVADRYNRSAPLLLIAVGIAVSFVPNVPRVHIDPELVLFGILPPLLYSSAIRASLIDFKVNRQAILLLSVGCVAVTTVAVGLVAWWVIPSMSLAAAFAIGAVVAPPDAVAAAAVARRVGMPRRITTILEGESLVNDATSLVALNAAIMAIKPHHHVSVQSVALDFVIAAGGGIAVGLVVAAILAFVRKSIDDPVLDTTLSFVAPFIAFLPAEEIHASGVLAVVVTGLMLGHKSPVLQSASSRIAENTNWRTISFILENLVFLLIGLQLRGILDDLHTLGIPLRTTVFSCGAILLATVVVRLLWVYACAAAYQFGLRKMRAQAWSWQTSTVVGWAGMRGVVTLAAVFLLPAKTATSHGTPKLALLQLAAFVVVAGTLVGQGSTLPWLVRVLKLRGPDAAEDALQAAGVVTEASIAGLRRLDEIATDDDPPEILAQLRHRATKRSNSAWERLGRTSAEIEPPSVAYQRLRLQMLAAERDSILKARNTGVLDDSVLRSALAAVDVEESLLDRVEDAESRLDNDLTVPTARAGDCEHLSDAPTVAVPNTPGSCEDCVREGLRWVHLRMCLTCGNVGCCDSSVGRHAERHFHESEHPVMRSVEPGEAWRWCYVDELLG